jgi:hypothetical protein
MQTLEESRALLLGAVSDAELTFYRSDGNRGDDLIEAGTRALLDGAGIPYRFLFAADLREYEGELLLLGGGGGWCRFWRHSPNLLMDARGFDRVVVFPSTYDLGDSRTRYVMEASRATFFAREWTSAEKTGAAFAHCPSLFYDVAPYRRPGSGVLHAFRTDDEASGAPIPNDNLDVSLIHCSLDAWLTLLAGYEEVHTDRAHVLFAAAMLGKRARWRDNGYFKVRACAATLDGYDVEELW